MKQSKAIAKRRALVVNALIDEAGFPRDLVDEEQISRCLGLMNLLAKSFDEGVKTGRRSARSTRP